MVTVSSTTACIPLVPFSVAAALTLRSPLSVLLAVQAKKFPDSKPSAKIKSEDEGVFVTAGVGVRVGVFVGVSEGPVVGVFVRVKVAVGVVPDPDDGEVISY